VCAQQTDGGELNGQSKKYGAICVAAIGLSTGGCSGLPQPGAPSNISASLLVTNHNSNVVVGRPKDIYQRIARVAVRCWFGPFGALHNRFMTSAEVPPDPSDEPVRMAVHRRLPDLKKPWGPSLLRIELTGTTTTTLSFENVGLEPQISTQMSSAFTSWANGRTDCPELREPETKSSSRTSSADQHRQ